MIQLRNLSSKVFALLCTWSKFSFRLLSHTKHIFQKASVCWPTAFHFATSIPPFATRPQLPILWWGIMWKWVCCHVVYWMPEKWGPDEEFKLLMQSHSIHIHHNHKRHSTWEIRNGDGRAGGSFPLPPGSWAPFCTWLLCMDPRAHSHLYLHFRSQFSFLRATYAPMRLFCHFGLLYLLFFNCFWGNALLLCVLERPAKNMFQFHTASWILLLNRWISVKVIHYNINYFIFIWTSFIFQGFSPLIY